jgi:hypothetical protein
MRALILAASLLVPSTAFAQNAEKRLIVTITAKELKGGVVSEITWDDGTLVLQGVFANPDGSLSPQYWVTPAEQISLKQQANHTVKSAAYWDAKARPVSPTGLGRITTASDAKMPMYGIADQSQRIHDAAQMGGTQKRHVVSLGKLVLHERNGPAAPYDGEIWGWSPPELNRIAYVDQSGDLWIARADGARPERILKGNFTLPAWSDDGRLIAVAEKKNNGAKWEISIVHVPERFRARERP